MVGINGSDLIAEDGGIAARVIFRAISPYSDG